MKRNAAFTLIELLVVVAILASIAIPSIFDSIEMARATQDANNLKSVGYGVQRYLADNEENFFKSDSPTSWPAALYPYLHTWQSFQSPFDKRPTPESAPYPVSYGVNQNCLDSSAAQWTAVSQLLIMADQKVAETGTNKFSGVSTLSPIIQPGAGLGVFKGGRMLNALYGDGHAVVLSLTDFKDIASSRGRERWVPVAP